MDVEEVKAEISSDSDIEVDEEEVARRQRALEEIPDTPSSSDSSSEKEGSDWTICLPSDTEGNARVKVKREPGSSNNEGQGHSSVQPTSSSASGLQGLRLNFGWNSRGPTQSFTDMVKSNEMKPMVMSTKRKRVLQAPEVDTSSSSESEGNPFRKVGMIDMSPFRPMVVTQNESSPYTSRIRQRTGLYGDLAELWKSKEFSDIVFQCEGGELKAHKLIVSARSEVFRAMFSSGMSETTSNIVKIDDIKLNTMKILVEYMYTGCVEPLSIEELAELLRAADKYQMNKLKNACFELLIGKMKVNNAGELVMLAHLHNADDRVKYKIQEYIIRMRGELWMVPEFKAMVAANPMVFCTMIYESYNQFKLNKN